MTDRYDSLFRAYALPGLSWMQLKAQAICESGLNPRAVSPVGAEGLAQFMPATWASVVRQVLGLAPATPTPAWAHPFDPELAIRAQALYMETLLKQLGGEWDAALAAYNWGLGNVRRVTAANPRTWRALLPDETRGYLARAHQVLAQVEGEAVSTIADVNAAVAAASAAISAKLTALEAKVLAAIQALKDQLAAGGTVTPADLDGVVTAVQGVATSAGSEADKIAGEVDSAVPPPPTPGP